MACRWPSGIGSPSRSGWKIAEVTGGGYCGAGVVAGAAGSSAGVVEAGGSAGGRRCWHSRNRKKTLTAATGTAIHGHVDDFFSVSLIVLPTSNRIAIYFSRRPPAT
jgi:hypothetical protein